MAGRSRGRSERRGAGGWLALAAGVAALAAAALTVWALLPGPSPAPPAPAAAGSHEGPSAAAGSPSATPGGVLRLRARVLAVHPHDPGAYTQGLLWNEGVVLESTGLYGASSLRRWDLESGEIYDRVALPAELFGEGLALAGDRLVQLTWREGRARVYDLASFKLRGELSYGGEGWGLCYDGRRLVMSDGSARLTFRDPATFTRLGEVSVTLEGRPLPSLNELECRPEGVYANLYERDEIARIDPESGRVTALIDASGLLVGADRAGAEVLNGIAYRPETDTFLLTGKRWPKLFEVVWVPAEPGGGSPAGSSPGRRQ
jgi:glutaminyl-peptide cyclotransferase